MTHEARTAWERMSDRARGTMVWILWFVTWIGLLAGLRDRTFYPAVVAFSAAHALLLLALHRFRISPFPVQVRIGFLLWMTIGTYVPHMTILMLIATVGLIGNLFFNYCLLARLMSLLPWNREGRLSFDLVRRVLLSPPVHSRFRPPAPG